MSSKPSSFAFLEFQLSEVVPHPPLRHMSSGCDEGTFLAAEIDGILFVKYQMRKGKTQL